MKHTISDYCSHEILSDGKTVWINYADGCCVGRFSEKGIDVHYDAERQMLLGRQCLDCKKGPTTTEDWQEFRHAMRLHYGIAVPERHMPKFLRTT